MKYEVFSPAFDGYVAPIPCADKQKAAELAQQLRNVSGSKFGTSCNWQVREVTEDMPPAPKAPFVTPIQVSEIQMLMAKHGQDAIVVLAWGQAEPLVHLSTAGSDLHYSEQAYQIGQMLVGLLSTDRAPDRVQEGT